MASSAIDAPALRAQPGPQRAFGSCSADIAVYGGAAGGGKSWGLVFEAARNVHVPGYAAIVLRRTSKQLCGGGSVWEESQQIYPWFGGSPREGEFLDWKFPTINKLRPATIEFGHLQHLKDVHSHQSKAYALIIFDELSQFLEGQFWYLVSRNRSKSSVRPYIRAATNPIPSDDKVGGWVRRLIDWWIDGDGFAIPERSGVLRWFVRVNDDLVWADTDTELLELYPEKRPLSFTFIAATLEDNPALTNADPTYVDKLDALPRVERERLKNGNWNVRPTAGMYFQGAWCEIVDAPPADVLVRCRGWDRAATVPTAENPDPDYTAGIKYSRDKFGTFYVEHAIRDRVGPAGVERMITNQADLDGVGCKIGLWQDPGSAGKADNARFVKLLARFVIVSKVASKNKQTYFEPVSSQAENHNVKLVRGPWLTEYVRELEGFPDGGHDDQVDGTSIAHIVCADDDLDHLRRMANK